MNPQPDLTAALNLLLHEEPHYSERQLLEYLENELAATLHDEIHAHLASCETCSAHTQELKHSLQIVTTDPTLKDRLWSRIVADIEKDTGEAQTDPLTLVQGGLTEAQTQKQQGPPPLNTDLPIRLAALERPAPVDSLPFHQSELQLTGKASPSPLNLDGASILWLRAMHSAESASPPPPVRATWPSGHSDAFAFTFYEKKQRWTVTIDIPMPWPAFMKLVAEGSVIVELSSGG